MMIPIPIKNTAVIFPVTLVLIACSFIPAFAKSVVLCTTFPIYQITRNVAETDQNLDIQLMLSNQMGCPHGYTLRPQDMEKIARADILVINGLGMEEFLDDSVQKENPQIYIIDSSRGMVPVTACTSHEHNAHNHSAKINPHLFTSPPMRAQIAMNIAAGLSRKNPGKASMYFQQAATYEKAMKQLADDMTALGKKLKNRKIIQPHGAFDYLARDMGLHIIATMLPHGQKPSAAEMIHLIGCIKKRKVGAIFTEPQYPAGAGQTLSRETGVPVVIIDPVATGPDNAPLDYYETIMGQNLQRIQNTLGTK